MSDCSELLVLHRFCRGSHRHLDGECNHLSRLSRSGWTSPMTAFHLGRRPRPRGRPLPRGTLPPPLSDLVGIPPLADGILDLLVVLVVAVPGVVGPPKVFRLGVAFRLAKLASPVPNVFSMSPLRPVLPFALVSMVDVSRPSLWRCSLCHRLIESPKGACYH